MCITGMCATRNFRSLIGCGADTRCALIGGKRGWKSRAADAEQTRRWTEAFKPITFLREFTDKTQQENFTVRHLDAEDVYVTARVFRGAFRRRSRVQSEYRQRVHVCSARGK